VDLAQEPQYRASFPPSYQSGKNWLFAGNDEAAGNAARLWSLIASCHRHAVDPLRYLTSVLAKVGQAPTRELDRFLPDIWTRDDATEPLPSESADQ
jgi:transposase